MDEASRKMVQVQMLSECEGGKDRLCPLQQKVRQPLMIFKAHKIDPIFKPIVRRLCTRRYPGHPNGCPNFGQRDMCPPRAPLFPDYFDTSYPFWALWVDFDLAQWVSLRQKEHPDWSYGQCANLRYWQQKAGKFLREHAQKICCEQGLEYVDCPEAMGIDVTSTMYRIGVCLEWPPKKIVRKVWILGVRK